LKYEIRSTQVFFYPNAMDIHWEAKNWSAKPGSPLENSNVFGILTFQKVRDGFVKADTEAMDEEFCIAVLTKFLQQAMKENDEPSKR